MQRAPLKCHAEEFYRFYSDLLRSMAARFGLHTQECEDVLQEVWLQVYLHVSQADWPENRPGLRLWLLTLFRNKAVDCIRRKARCPVQTVGTMADQHAANPSPDPAEQCEESWERQLVHRLLADLKERESPTNCRLLVMRWLDERPLGEVAKALGLTQNEASCRQQRMFQKMRAALALYQGHGFAGDSTISA